MPQNAIIRASGGDYPSISAWEAGEQSSNYGSITVGRVDGFFNESVTINGTWTHGARLEPFDPADAFDGTERMLCGVDGGGGGQAISYNTSIFEMEGLELYKTAGGGSTKVLDRAPSGTLTPVLRGLLLKAVGRRTIEDVVGLEDSVLVCDGFAFFESGTCSITNCNVFSNNSIRFGQTGGMTATNVVSYNSGAGDDFDGTVTQTNCASSDATGSTLTNIVIADNFEDTNPIANGDYRIKSGSPLDTNGIGAFISAATGLEITVPLISIATTTYNPELEIGQVIDTPLVSDTPATYNAEVLQAQEVDLNLIPSVASVYNPEVTGITLIDLDLVSAAPTVYTATVEVKQDIELDQVQPETQVYTVYILEDGEIIIPVEDRVTWQRVAAYLRTQGFVGQTNDVIYEWLFTSGYSEGQMNDRWWNYLGDRGYSGDMTDRRGNWRQG